MLTDRAKELLKEMRPLAQELFHEVYSEHCKCLSLRNELEEAAALCDALDVLTGEKQ